MPEPPTLGDVMETVLYVLLAVLVIVVIVWLIRRFI